MSFDRSILITGGTSGLGFECALCLARQYPEFLIVIASRNDPDSTAISINTTLEQKNVSFLPLDLSDLANVRSFVKHWESEKYPPIQALLLNAGLQFPNGIRYSTDGIEATFAISHVGHALLYHLLQPYLASNARVVVTASGSHDSAKNTGMPEAKYTTAEELAHPSAETIGNSGRQRYTTSKLVNVMWTYALDRHVRSSVDGENDPTPPTIVAFDPGLMPGTGLAREAGLILRWLWTSVLPRLIPLLRRLVDPNIYSARESGATLAWLAVDPQVEGVSGVYYESKKQIKSSVESYDVGKQEDLWQWTIENIATSKEEQDSFV